MKVEKCDGGLGSVGLAAQIDEFCELVEEVCVHRLWWVWVSYIVT